MGWRDEGWLRDVDVSSMRLSQRGFGVGERSVGTAGLAIDGEAEGSVEKSGHESTRLPSTQVRRLLPPSLNAGETFTSSRFPPSKALELTLAQLDDPLFCPPPFPFPPLPLEHLADEFLDLTMVLDVLL